MNPIGNPRLTEPGVKFFLNQTLKNCHQTKKNYYNMIVNTCLLFLFVLIFGILLRIKYKGKLTPREKRIKERKIQEYLISKLKIMEVDRRRQKQDLITNLPMYKSEFQASERNLYQ